MLPSKVVFTSDGASLRLNKNHLGCQNKSMVQCPVSKRRLIARSFSLVLGKCFDLLVKIVKDRRGLTRQLYSLAIWPSKTRLGNEKYLTRKIAVVKQQSNWHHAKKLPQQLTGKWHSRLIKPFLERHSNSRFINRNIFVGFIGRKVFAKAWMDAFGNPNCSTSVAIS